MVTLFRGKTAMAKNNGGRICPKCGTKREVHTAFTISGDEEFLDHTFAEIGIPPYDIVWARNAEHLWGLEFTGDADAVLGAAKE